jgi:hypothetical protein
MTRHVFVDESRRTGTYLLAAADLGASDLARTRTALRTLCLPGMRRMHFQAEGDGRRRDLLAHLVAGRAQVTIYCAQGRTDQARAACLATLVADILSRDARRLVLESRGEPGDRADRLVVAATMRRIGAAPDQFSYEHLRPYEEPALWIADAVAWCHGAGGEWRRRVAPLVRDVIGVDRQGQKIPSIKPRQREARAPVVRRVPPGLTSSTERSRQAKYGN